MLPEMASRCLFPNSSIKGLQLLGFLTFQLLTFGPTLPAAELPLGSAATPLTRGVPLIFPQVSKLTQSQEPHTFLLWSHFSHLFLPFFAEGPAYQPHSD